MKHITLLLFCSCLLVTSAIAQFQYDSQHPLNQLKIHGKIFEWADHDSDGDLDLFIINENQWAGILLKNNISSFDSIYIYPKSSGYADMQWVDYDQDGLLDIFMTSYSSLYKNQFYKNYGRDIFLKHSLGDITDNNTVYALCDWADYDNDGDMDLYLGAGGSHTGRKNLFYENRKHNGFSLLENSITCQSEKEIRQVNWLDLDADHDLDLYLLNYSQTEIFIQDGESTAFSEVTNHAMDSYTGVGSSSWLDFNHDGLPDEFSISGAANLHIANPDFTYNTTPLNLGLQFSNYIYHHDWGDFDNDGDQDLLVVSEVFAELFRNDGNNTWVSVSIPELQPQSYDKIQFVDHDLDGWLDIFASASAQLLLLQNTGNQNNYLTVKLEGTNPNSSVDNAKLTLYVGQKTYYKARQDRMARQGQNYPFYHFGINQAAKVDSLVVRWPSGYHQVIKNITPNQLLTVEEPLPEKPAAPENFLAEAVSHKAINLSWLDKSDWEAGFILQKKQADNSYLTIHTSWQNELYYLDQNLKHSTVYHYRLFAYNKAGNSDTIYTSTSTQELHPPPEAPSDLKAEKITSNSLLLTWQDNTTSEEHFILERAQNSPTHFVEISQPARDQTSFTDKNLEADTQYYYRIKANNQGSMSAYSAVEQVKTDILYFSAQPINWENYQTGAIGFGDFDNDQKADLIWSGKMNGIRKTRIFTHLNGTMDSVVSDVKGTWYYNLQVVDYNHDNELDVAIPNRDYQQSGLFIGVKDGPNLINVSPDQILSEEKGSISTADLNRDGKPEFIIEGEGLKIVGRDLWNKISTLQTLKPDNYHRACIALDYDNDQDVDLISFYRKDFYKNTAGAALYRNQGSEFSIEELPIDYNIYFANQADYDNDGDQDLLALENVGELNYLAHLFAKTAEGFQEVYSFESGKTATWIDYDLDGDLDLLLPGVFNQELRIYETQIMINKGGGQFDASLMTELHSGRNDEAAIGDFNGDGAPDIALSKDYPYSNHELTLYKNQVKVKKGIANLPPDIPGELSSEKNFNQVTFHWSKVSDLETPEAGLTYNLVVIRNQDYFTVSPLADLQTGIRKTTGPGNMMHSTSYTLHCLPDGEYQWSVQAIDPTGNASAFAPFQSFTISGTLPLAPDQLQAETQSDKKISIQWQDQADNETNYILQRKNLDSLDGKFNMIALLPENTNHFTDDSVLPDTRYTYQVAANNCSGNSQFTPSAETKTYLPHFTLDSLLYLEGKSNLADLGDYDLDGDFDLLLNFYPKPFDDRKIIVLEQQENKFLQVLEMPGIGDHDFLQWIDINQDGYLDIFVLITDKTPHQVNFYLNQGNKSFSNAGDLGLKINRSANLRHPVWVDFNNDGLPDLLVNGTPTSGEPNNGMRIYQNNGENSFTELQSPFTGVYMNGNPCIDFNKDGYTDIVASEENSNGKYDLVLYLNIGNFQFNRINTGLPGLSHRNHNGSVDWFDYNGDGFPDLILAGQHTGSNGTGISRIYVSKNALRLESITTSIPSFIQDVKVKGGDFNNDGNDDVLLFGNSQPSEWTQSFLTQIYGHSNGNLTKFDLPYLDLSHQYGGVLTGDLDQDGDLDMIHLGEKEFNQERIVLFRNQIANSWQKPNEPPQAPGSLKEENNDDGIILRWNASTDDLDASLTYNLVLISATDTLIIANALPNGRRIVNRLGNAFYNQFMLIKKLQPGIYQWAVQAIDPIGQGSAFSDYSTFTIGENNILTGVTIPREHHVILYPNPTKDLLTLKYLSGQQVKISIVSVQGQLHKQVISKIVDGETTINIQKLPAGMYAIILQDKDQVHNLKFLKK